MLGATQEADPDPDVMQRACTPLRPGYAPDLRDAALAEHDATELVITQEMGFTFPGSVSGVLLRLLQRMCVTLAPAVCFAGALWTLPPLISKQRIHARQGTNAWVLEAQRN